MRIPFPWEAQPDPLAGVESADVAPPVHAVSAVAEVSVAPVTSGFAEPQVGGEDVRECAAKFARDMQRRTGMPREWCERQTRQAVRGWDRGIRDGSIRKP